MCLAVFKTVVWVKSSQLGSIPRCLRHVIGVMEDSMKKLFIFLAALLFLLAVIMSVTSITSTLDDETFELGDIVLFIASMAGLSIGTFLLLVCALRFNNRKPVKGLFFSSIALIVISLAILLTFVISGITA